MKTIDDMEKSFIDMQNSNDEQFKTIVELKKQIEFLQAENKRLKDSSVIPIIGGNNISNEEIICLTQLTILKDRATRQELTKEECQKTEIYVKILESIRKNSEKDNTDFDKMTEEELLKIVGDDLNVGSH